jgi:hypothetical protein
VHFSGATMARNLDHPVIEGVFPVERWRAGQRLRDRWTFTLPGELPPGTYSLLLGLYRANERLAVTPSERADSQRRVIVGRIDVR